MKSNPDFSSSPPIEQSPIHPFSLSLSKKPETQLFSLYEQHAQRIQNIMSNHNFSELIYVK